MTRDELVRSLLQHLGAGSVEPRHVLPALRALSEPGQVPSRRALLLALREESLPELQALAIHLAGLRARDAQLHHELRQAGQAIPAELSAELADLPTGAALGWPIPPGVADTRAAEAVGILRDRLFFEARRESVPRIAAGIAQAERKARARLGEQPSPWAAIDVRALITDLEDETGAADPELRQVLDRVEASAVEVAAQAEQRAAAAIDALPSPPPGDLDEDLLLRSLLARFRAGTSPAERSPVLDMALLWPTPRAVTVLREMCIEPWAQERAGLLLSLRFGRVYGLDWRAWLQWLESQPQSPPARPPAPEDAPYLVYLWYSALPGADPALVTALEALCRRRVAALPAAPFLQRWRGSLSAEELAALRGQPTVPAASGPVAPVGSAAPAPRPAPTAAAPRPVPVRPAPPPSPLWREHVSGFMAENWYMVAGVVMVVAGASLLAYFTWDKHWLLRYTIMPALLAGFTAALGGTAGWLERKDTTLRGTGAVLRGAAIALLPVNFMAVALLAVDPQVTSKLLVVPAMAALYLVFFGRQLVAWCRAVEPRLALPLGGSLLLLDALVLLRPLVGPLDASMRSLVLGAGFHAGFVVLALCVRYYALAVLDKPQAEQRRVPWFVIGSLVVTALEVFAWVHGSLRDFPRAAVYAPLVVLAGGLVLFVERRFLELLHAEGAHAAESFLGFALVLFGALMGAGDPYLRVVAFTLAGLVWLYQAAPRQSALHYWIGATLLVLGGASIGLVPPFPRPWLGALGIALAMGVAALGARTRVALLRAVCDELQLAVLTLSAMVAVLTQWHYRSPPLLTALCLLVIAFAIAHRAERDQRARLLHTAMVLLSLSLPYLGFADMAGHRLRGNTMVFGLGALSLLWLLLLVLRPTPLRLRARSSVLVLYGGFALAAMGLRVLVERGRASDPLALLLDSCGPLLMAAVLLVATYHSRSLVPAAMAAAIVIVLFPEMRAGFQAAWPQLAWGTGYGSSWSALLLVLVCFRLREAAWLRKLGDGDPFLEGEPFPLRRFDHTLFTGPLLASAVFLAVKVDLWSFLRNLHGGRLPAKTAIALIVTAACWTLLAVFWRDRSGARALAYGGLLWLFPGVWFTWRAFAATTGRQWPLLAFGLALQGLELLYLSLRERHPWLDGLLRAPTCLVLRIGSLVAGVGCLLLLLDGRALHSVDALSLFVALQLVRFGIEKAAPFEGTLLFLLGLGFLLAATAPGSAPLLLRITIERSLLPVLGLCLGLQALHVVLELAPEAYAALRPLLRPAQVFVALILLGLGAFTLIDIGQSLSLQQQSLLLATLLLAAREHASGPFALLALLVGDVVVHFDALRAESNQADQLALLASPWRWSALALAMVLLAQLGRFARERWPRSVAGSYGLPPLGAPVLPWVQAPALAFALLASLRHTLDSGLRAQGLQLFAPYLGALTFGVVAWAAQVPALFGAAVCFVSLGNIHAVRFWLGDALRARGLSDVHLIVLGLGVTLLQATLVRLLARSERVIAFVHRTSLAVAALVLTLLSANYFAHPNLEEITPLRFAISGAMALAASLYFRRASRSPGPGEAEHAELCESLYHFGVAMAVWCAALLVPWLRRPSTALIALGLPALYFYLRAELDHSHETGRRYRDSASRLGFVLLGLYALRPVFQMVLFPDTPIYTDHYHHNAAFAMALGVMLLRLHGLGGTEWLAFYGGCAIMAGSYFGLTAWPGLSPFDAPMPAAWCGVGLAHFWTVASEQRSPLRSALQALAGLDRAAWTRQRVAWGRAVLAASQLLVVLGIADYGADTYMVAPLLLGAASVWVHQGLILESAAYQYVAVALVTLALHADFFVPSYLDREAVIAVLLLLWAVWLVVAGRLGFSVARIGLWSGLLAAAAMAHVFYHHPSSSIGLWAVAFIALLGALVPSVEGGSEPVAALLLLAPTWLVYFSQAPLRSEGVAGAFRTWPLLATLASVFVTGLVGKHCPAPATPAVWRLYHQAQALLARAGADLHTLTLVATFTAGVVLQLAHYTEPYAPRALALFGLLYAAWAIAFYQEGSRRRALWAYLAAEASVVLLFALLRRQLLLTTSFWSYEYDVWASLAVSLLLSGAKHAFDARPREVRLPLVGSILVLPVIALVWTLLHHLGSDVALVVVGLHSLMFTYLGKDRRDSPYNMVAVAGFVLFVLIVFWSKLELRTLHAYVIPVGLGVLALLQMFGDRLEAGARNGVRLITLLAMLGSAGWYALADDRYPVAFNVTLLALCLASMALGTLLRIRLYLVLGFLGVIVDVASILVKGLAHLDRGERMTSVGILVLLVGAGLVFGAVYYKTHRERVDAWTDAWRARLMAWE